MAVAMLCVATSICGCSAPPPDPGAYEEASRRIDLLKLKKSQLVSTLRDMPPARNDAQKEEKCRVQDHLHRVNREIADLQSWMDLRYGASR